MKRSKVDKEYMQSVHFEEKRSIKNVLFVPRLMHKEIKHLKKLLTLNEIKGCLTSGQDPILLNFQVVNAIRGKLKQ